MMIKPTFCRGEISGCTSKDAVDRDAAVTAAAPAPATDQWSARLALRHVTALEKVDNHNTFMVENCRRSCSVGQADLSLDAVEVFPGCGLFVDVDTVTIFECVRFLSPQMGSIICASEASESADDRETWH